MPSRARDWFRQAERDLAHARSSRRLEDHDWACFAAQQAAEKAVKAVHQALGQEAWGHSVAQLLEALRSCVPDVPSALIDAGRALDKLYIPARYPNGLPAGIPAELFTAGESEKAVGDAERIVDFCRGNLPK